MPFQVAAIYTVTGVIFRTESILIFGLSCGHAWAVLALRDGVDFVSDLKRKFQADVYIYTYIDALDVRVICMREGLAFVSTLEP